MRINIYGVGRSGTKAIHLWIAYLLAQEYGSVWVGYEPFHYLNRNLEPNDRGRAIHRDMPLFVTEAQRTPVDFREYCENLASHKVGVVKFIRANGRINAINRVMQPDLSLLIVRDLYQVLASITSRTWSLVENNFEWRRLCEEAGKLYPFLTEMGCLQPTTDELLRNAIYWFTMNKCALENLEDTFVIDYDALGDIRLVLSHLGLQCHDKPLSASMFRGDNLHSNYPLQDLPQTSMGDSVESPGKKGAKLIKFFKRHTPGRVKAFLRPLVHSNEGAALEPIGSMCHISKRSDTRNEAPSCVPSSRVVVSRNDLFDDLRARVLSSLNANLERQRAMFASQQCVGDTA